MGGLFLRRGGGWNDITDSGYRTVHLRQVLMLYLVLAMTPFVLQKHHPDNDQCTHHHCLHSTPASRRSTILSSLTRRSTALRRRRRRRRTRTATFCSTGVASTPTWQEHDHRSIMSNDRSSQPAWLEQD
jgi:hypothetical protein